MPDIGIIATSPNKNGPCVDIVREVRHNYNHKPPKKSREKNYKLPRRTCTRFRAAAPLFAARKGDENRPKSTAENHPASTPKTTPKTTPENVSKLPPKTPH